jgi:hypothetical protein
MYLSVFTKIKIFWVMASCALVNSYVAEKFVANVFWAVQEDSNIDWNSCSFYESEILHDKQIISRND